MEKIRLADGTDLTAAMQFMTPDEPRACRRPDGHAREAAQAAAARAKRCELELTFKAKVPRTIRRSGYYHNGYFIGQWFPKPGVYQEGKGWNCHQYHLNSEFFADFAGFRVHITVPQRIRRGRRGKGDGPPAATPSARRPPITFEQDRIHDFAWTADPDYIRIERDFIADQRGQRRRSTGRSPATLRLPLEEVKLRDVKMILLINPEHRGQADRHFKALRMALKYYGLWYGAYPYETGHPGRPARSAAAAAAWNTRPCSPPAPRSCPARRPTIPRW